MAKKPKFTQGDDNVNLGKGDNVANAKGGNDSVAGGAGNDTINGGAGNDFLRGGTGDDILNGGEGDDRLAGGEGDDTLNGGTGVNVVDGGTGDDLVVLDGNFADAKITATDTGFKIVTAGGTTTVSNVESFQFADGVKGAGDLLPGAGKTFVLTVPIDNIAGTTGDDTIVGDNNSFTADVIAGGDGKDVLKIATATAATSGTPTMSGVERIEVTGSTAFTTTLNLVNTTGVTSLALNSGDKNATLTSVKGILDLEVSNTTAGTLSVTYDAAAVAGTTDTQKLAVNNAVLTGLTVNGAETLAITAGGTANNLGTVTDAAAKAITVAGAGAVTLALANTTTALTSFDASAATGKVSVTFAATSDVVAKGGAADDTFLFGATFTGADKVDGGAGKDTVGLDGGAFTLATDATVVALNALANVENVRFTGAAATSIDRNTLTNATITGFEFAGAGAVTVANAKTADTYTFSNIAGAGATFTTSPTTLNIVAAGTEFSSTTAHADADINNITATTSSVINIASNGLAADATGLLPSLIGGADQDYTNTVEARVNNLGTVTGALNATINLTGNAHTVLAFGQTSTLDATKLTGDLQVTGFTGNDTIKGGAGVNDITGGQGVDAIDISASAGKIDYIHLETVLTAVDRDSITGFKAGAGGDVTAIALTATTQGTAAAANAPGFLAVDAVIGAADVTATAATDIIEFNFNNIGTSLGDGSAGSLTGANLLALIDNGGAGSLKVAADQDNVYAIAYQNGNAYLYYIDESNDAGTDVGAGEIALVAEYKGVAVGALDVGNFDLV